MDVFQYRQGLQRARRAIARGTLTVGYIGGSISDPRPGNCWPEFVSRWLATRFPGVRIVEENAAIGATGSDLAAFRAQRDLIARGCDLVFVEFAVNDQGAPAVLRNRTREGLLRQLLAGDGCDVVLAYTFCPEMYDEMHAGRVPDTIADFEVLADHYGLPSVWMGLYALQQVEAGRIRWEEWLPDNLHPQHFGSSMYAESVTALLERELCTAPSAGEIPAGARRPAPLDPLHWEAATLLPFSAVRAEGPWRLRRWPSMEWIEQVWDTAAIGARLAFAFHGRVLALGFDFGKTSSEFRYRLDGGDWVDVVRERPDWCGAEGWFRLSILLDAPTPAAHEVEIEVTRSNAPGNTGTNFRLGLIGVVA